MSDNFFTDNLDIQFRLEQLDLSEIVELKENGYSYAQKHQEAPRNYADAKDNYRLMLEVLGGHGRYAGGNTRCAGDRIARHLPGIGIRRHTRSINHNKECVRR